MSQDNLSAGQRLIHNKNEKKMQELKFEQAVRNQVPQRVLEQGDPADQIIANTAIDDARELYFRFAPMAKIASATGIHIETIRGFVYAPTGWKKTRDALQKELKEEVRIEVTKRLSKLEGISMDILEKGMTGMLEMMDRGVALDPTSIEKIASSMMKINKVKVNELGDNKEGTKVAMLPQEMLEAIAADPYLRKSISVQEVIEISDAEVYGEPDQNS